MMGKPKLIEASRKKTWTVCGKRGTIDEISLGCQQRIADAAEREAVAAERTAAATEAMARPTNALLAEIAELERVGRMKSEAMRKDQAELDSFSERIVPLMHSNSALKGVRTKLRKKVAGLNGRIKAMEIRAKAKK